MAQKFPEEFKRDGVMMVWSGDLRVHEVTNNFGVVRRRCTAGFARPTSTTAGVTARPAVSVPNWWPLGCQSIAWRGSWKFCAVRRPTARPPRSQTDVPLVCDMAAQGFSVWCDLLWCSVSPHRPTAPVARSRSQARTGGTTRTINAVIDANLDDPAFGYQLLADELVRAGIAAGERRVWRLCSQQKLWSTTVRTGRTGKRPGPAVRDDYLRRDFTATALNRTWVTNITEHPAVGQGKVYCCSVKDLFSHRIIGYAIADRITAELAVATLRAAIT